MSTKNVFIIKIIISVLSFIGVILYIPSTLEALKIYNDLNIPITTLLFNYHFILVTLILISVNVLIWLLPNTISTPAELAERKRIRQERKKAKLQEKLNKMQ